MRKTLRSLLSIAFVSAATSAYAVAQDIYVNQGGSGGGTSCADAKDISFANTQSNWGSGANQIGPGTTLHLCETINAPAGATGLTVMGSGTPTSPIIIKFEPNAILQSPAFGHQPNFGSNAPCDVIGGCPSGVDVTGVSNIIVDGGTNGIIQNTSNGTLNAQICLGGTVCQYDQESDGMDVTGTNIIVRNLTIRNIYMNQPLTADCYSDPNNPIGSLPLCAGPNHGVGGGATIDIGAGGSGISICNNVLTNSKIGLGAYSDSTRNVDGNPDCQSNIFAPGNNYFLNTLDDHGWQMSAGGGGPANGTENIYANDLGGSLNWQFPTDSYHSDGIIAFTNGGATVLYIYNNYFYGDMGYGNTTAEVFCTPGSGGPGGPYSQTPGGNPCVVFNNLFADQGHSHSAVTFGSEVSAQAAGTYYYNNTFVNFQPFWFYGNYNSANITGYGNKFTLANNIFQAGSDAPYWFWNNYMVNYTSSMQWSQILNWNNNVYNFNPGSGGGGTWAWGPYSYGSTISSLPAWQAACLAGGGTGCDTQSINTNPNLDPTTFHLQSGSPAIGLGANLTSQCLKNGGIFPDALCSDKPTVVGFGGLLVGNPRPTCGPWDAGAYQFAANGGCDTTPPTISLNPPGTVSGNATFSGTASDNVAVAAVQISLDGGPFYLATSTANWTFRLDTIFWENGSHTITVKAADPSGNTSMASGSFTIANTGSGNITGAADWWKLDDGSGSTAVDSSGNGNTGTLNGGTSWTTGILNGAVAFDGVSGSMSTANQFTSPQIFSLSLWFKTTTTSGGKLIGFSTSGQYDHHIYMTNSGQIVFGVYTNGFATVASTTSYNDGKWHYVAGTLGSNGMILYMDGVAMANDPTVALASGNLYTGSWGLAAGGLNSWPNAPTSSNFNGNLDDVRVYNNELGATDVAGIYDSATQTPPPLGSDIYLNQGRTGGGTSCSDAMDYSFFNNSANWATTHTPGKIGPGTTVHLCGTFTLPAGMAGLSILGSGTSGNYITIKFEPGAVLQSPYFGGSEGGSGGCGPKADCLGGIQVYQQSYVIIDGGTNGIIQNTANGTNLANQQSSNGIYMQGDHLIVRNLTVQDIYMNNGSSSTATDTGGGNTLGILCDGPCTNVAIYNNRVYDSKVGIGGSFNATTGPSACPAFAGVVGVTTKSLPAPTGNWGVCIYNNNLSDHDWQLGPSVLAGGALNIYANEWGDIGSSPGWLNWQFPTSAYHQDGLITFTASGLETVYVYDNYSHGDLGQGSPSAHIYCASNDYSGPTSGGCALIAFNNVVVQTGSVQWPNDAENDSPFAIDLSNYSIAGPMTLYNNTVIGGGQSIVAYTTPDSSPQGGPKALTLRNNIFVPGVPGTTTGWYDISSNGGIVISSVTASNNLYYNGNTVSVPYDASWWLNNSNSYLTLSAWQAACNCDLSGTQVANPNLSATFSLQAGSPAIGLGANLTSLNIPALNVDLAGNIRSSTAAWDAGAYQYCPPGACTQTLPPPICGDGICNGNETCTSCPTDCGVCASPPPGPTTLPAIDRNDLPSSVEINDSLSITNYPDSNVSFVWSFALAGGNSAGAPSVTARAATASFTSGAKTSSLASYGLQSGTYQVSVYAVDGMGDVSNTLTKTITLVSADLSGLKVYPNPWRSDKHSAFGMTFDGLTLGTTIKIFTVSAHEVKELNTDGPSITWDLTNDSGDKVASGIYIYLITDSQGDKVRGKVAVIR